MIKLNCPVCEYKEIEGNICPNCDTDISLIRRLYELPLVTSYLGAVSTIVATTIVFLRNALSRLLLKIASCKEEI